MNESVEIHLNARWLVEKNLSFWSRLQADSGNIYHLWIHKKWFPPRFPSFASHRGLSSYITWIPRFCLMSGGAYAQFQVKWTSQLLRKSRRSLLGKICKLRFRQTPDQSEVVFPTNSYPSANHGGGHSATSVVAYLRLVTLCVFPKFVVSIVFVCVNFPNLKILRSEKVRFCLFATFAEMRSGESRDSSDLGGYHSWWFLCWRGCLDWWFHDSHCWRGCLDERFHATEVLSFTYDSSTEARHNLPLLKFSQIPSCSILGHANKETVTRRDSVPRMGICHSWRSSYNT